MIISTEQVSKYHPDKYADQISDAILTECLRQDPESHVAVETMVKDTIVILGGEITSNASLNYEEIVNRVADKLNYNVTGIINLIGKQSPEINNAVISKDNLGAGDQGIMFGYATKETESRLPFAFDLANKIIKKIEGDVWYGVLKGDAKTQVTYNTETQKVESVLVSVCHKENYSLEYIREYVKTLLEGLVDPDVLLVNPAGTWTIGGPVADCGLTGRKIVCDQYGGFCPVGGGAFSGKDPTKVDRSASYMARKIAVDLVDEFDLEWCEVQLGYAIGVPEPVSVNVKTSDNVAYDIDFNDYVRACYNLTPAGIIEHLGLLDIDYEQLSEGCHYRYREGIDWN